ncbi:MAG: SEL1-like repeat protein [Devosia sp.]|nr:SEL1-like repeat protein [Devosia sp.]
MARAYPQSDYADSPRNANGGEWQALRGELVALLDQVESRFARSADDEGAMGGLSQRVRYLRDQVEAPEPALRRREALRTVKRAVDRFSMRDDRHDDEEDALHSAIAEIRSRQGAATISAIDRRPSDSPEFRELSGLVSGISDRLGRLEGDLRHQRGNASQVLEVAAQVEQLTQVVELLAGAVGETGQVKRLEAQIAALGAMIEKGPKVDLGAINARLDDVSATVGKLAELQAQQMEREIVRQERDEAAPKGKLGKLEPAMHAIESSVRSVYDRIDAIEKNLALSSGDFERLTAEMAAFTQAMRDQSGTPELLMGKVEALVARMDGVDSGNHEVVALKHEIGALQKAVMSGMEPRFLQIESQIEALSGRISPVDTSAVEGQLRQLMSRMDDAGAQLDGLARLYHDASDRPDLDALADLVAERTSDAVSRKAPAPVAMFGPDSLKTIEDRISSLVRSVSKGPDLDALASMVAEKTTAAIGRRPEARAGLDDGSIDALEKRMTALFNTAGKDTAERLTRLEATLAARQAGAPVGAAAESGQRPAARTAGPDAFAAPREETARLDSLLSRLSAAPSDVMPDNPADDAPLIDKGFNTPAAARSEPRTEMRASPAPAVAEQAAARPAFDPGQVQRPPRPQSSFAPADKEAFATPPMAPSSPAVEASASSTSTFVAAARRAQRLRHDQETLEPAGSSLISRALARVRPQPKVGADPVEQPLAPVEAEKPARRKKTKAAPVAPEIAPGDLSPAEGAVEPEPQAGFLTRYRRPLLLGAALVAVSLLTLNLVMQRMGAQRTEPAPVASSSLPEAGALNPPPSDDQSLVAPRIIDMIDATTVGSINPGAPMSFSKDAIDAPMPGALTPAESADALVLAPTSGALAADGAEVVTAPQSFDLPPEDVGPLELRQAAASGDARAQFEVAAIYTEGRALTQDLAEAASWYERSAAQGFAPAQYRLGNLYEAGTGLEKDLEMARLWYQRAAEAGNRMAMHNLAALYAGGQLGEQQFDAAAQWFSQAAANGMTDSQFNLGMLYARGLGVEQDFEQSYKWFSLAARSGDKDAAQARDDIAKSLSADAVGRITDTVRTWSAAPIALDANFAPIGTWLANFNPGETITAKDVTTRVQEALNKLGFNVGTPDGVAGPKTAEAIRAFERGTGMSESGKINPRLLAVLGSQPV